MSNQRTRETSSGTSSRLNRQRSSDEQAQDQSAASVAVTYGERALDRSEFFSAISHQEVGQHVMAYVFGQYGFFRLQLHTWFAVCLLKAKNAADPAQRSAIMALADHIFTDLEDNHDLMFGDFLAQLGFDAGRLHGDRPSPATLNYISSFAEDHSMEECDLFTAMAALSGRELVVALRNRRLLTNYFDSRSQPRPLWLALHAELEVEHFLDALRPALDRCGADAEALATVQGAIAHTIDRHVDYFDALYRERSDRATNTRGGSG